ncbi:MAG: hypothetical protein ACLFN0_09095 [Thermovirgaceae bacterium]
MWMKDGNGNWYMAGQKIKKTCDSSEGCWEKDSAGSWVLLEEIHDQGADASGVKVSLAGEVLAEGVV